MGLPRLWGKVKVRQPLSRSYRATQLGPVIRGKDDDEREPLSVDTNRAKKTKSLLSGIDTETTQTIVYYTVLLCGAFGFYRCLMPLTNFQELKLVSFSKNA